MDTHLAIFLSIIGVFALPFILILIGLTGLFIWHGFLICWAPAVDVIYMDLLNRPSPEWTQEIMVEVYTGYRSYSEYTDKLIEFKKRKKIK